MEKGVPREMNWIQIWAEGNTLVIETGSLEKLQVRSFTRWWRYFWKEETQCAIEDNLPHACIVIRSLRIV